MAEVKEKLTELERKGYIEDMKDDLEKHPYFWLMLCWSIFASLSLTLFGALL